ncbi:DUF4349 domain-containing protein [Flaviaesturariibacter amylovorans]|uniref:DUF4349 domain-containing protein n=1 Tax=Flaviaesturariibacter amylovorans TaxID=1084520 RepID=A0ABP8HMG2_9BACT
MRILLLAGALVATLSACNTNEGYAPEKIMSDSTGTGFGIPVDTAAATAGDPVKIVKTAGLRMKVTDVYAGTKDIAALVRGLSGTVSHQEIRTNEGAGKEWALGADSVQAVTVYHPGAELVVRVPSERLEEFVFAVSDRARFLHSSVLDIDDRSLAYLEAYLRQQNRQAYLEATPATVKGGGDGRRVAVADEAITQAIRQRQINTDVRWSTVRLSLWQDPVLRREVRANTDMDAYGPSFGARLRSGLADGWNGFLVLLIGLAHLWPFLLLAAGAWLIYRAQLARKASA